VTLFVAVRRADGQICPEIAPSDIVSCTFKPCLLEEIKPAVLELMAMRTKVDLAVKQEEEEARARTADILAERKAARERTVLFFFFVSAHNIGLIVREGSVKMKQMPITNGLKNCV